MPNPDDDFSDWHSPYSIPFPNDPKVVDEVFNAPSWSGAIYDHYMGVPRDNLPPVVDPGPTFEERVQRCEAMGIVVCLCSSHHLHEDPDAPLVMVHHPRCQIHGSGR